MIIFRTLREIKHIGIIKNDNNCRFIYSFQGFIFRVVRGPFIEEFHQCVTFGFYTAVWQVNKSLIKNKCSSFIQRESRCQLEKK